MYSVSSTTCVEAPSDSLALSANRGAPNFPSQEQLLIPLLSTLNDEGGRAAPAVVYDRLAERLEVTAEDRAATLPDSSVRVWDRHVRWVRQRAVLSGLIGTGTFNLWDLTESGKNLIENIRPTFLVTCFESESGNLLWAEAQAAAAHIERGSVQLVLTSPPYPLINRKAYANQFSSKEHVDWLLNQVASFKPLLSSNGSMVLNLGPVWTPGQPTQDPYIERLMVRLCDEAGWHLGQRLYWHNGARLPSPAEWVTVRRIRLKDPIEHLLWMSPTPNPFTNTRALLRPYSESMQKKLAAGGERGAKRPSGHNLLPGAFSANNGGAIASTVFTYANTSSNDAYLRYCKENKLPIHPARFPVALASDLIEMLSAPGDLIFDPFVGSGTVPQACEERGRRYLGSDKSLAYLRGAYGRLRDCAGAKWLLPA